MATNHLTPRKFLGREIRLAREAKGMKPEEFASEIHVSLSLVRMWERGDRIPVPADMNKIQTFFGFNGYLKRIQDDLINEAIPQEWFGKWVKVEEACLFLWSFEPLLVPGLLQTEEYMTCVLETLNYVGDLEKDVQARLNRQAVLTKDDAPTLIAIMDLSVLERCVGDAGVMQRQMIHLLEMAKRRNVIINFVPLSSPVCGGFLSGFAIANINGGSDVAYVDNQLNGEVVEGVEAVASLRNMFELFRAAALNRNESIRLIEKAADKWKP